MLTDEQILAKAAKLLENLDEEWSKSERSKRKSKCDNPKGFTMKQFCKNQRTRSKKGEKTNETIDFYEEKVLREVTEDEMRVLENVLDDLDPAKLPLNDLFSGKMRVVIPFPTMDTESDLGKFVKFFDIQEYEVDWDKGIVSATREQRGGALDLLGRGRNEPSEKKTKKIQMKIGKLFPKIAQTASKLDELFQIIKKEGEGKAWWNYAIRPGQVSGNVVHKVLSDEQIKSWDRLTDQMYDYIPNPGYFAPKWDETVEYFQNMSKYWQKNAGYIKDEIENLTNDKYSIIITRHPIDVLRMSDFDNITSCHSPASRTSAYQSYYKCAVAEAQGHGAVAYVVETEELLINTYTDNIDSAEQEIQEGEIFADDARYGGAGFDINPISRTRIRHMRYYDTLSPKRWDDGQDIGVPEKRIYGAAIPGIREKVVDWARQTQEEIIANMPKQDGKIDLDRVTMFGGSYEDTSGTTGRRELMMQLTGITDVDQFVGYIKQNTETEDALDADLLGDIRAQYEQQCSEIEEHFNMRMAACTVNYEIQDDGDDGVYIVGGAQIRIVWDADEWSKLPNSWDNVTQDSVSAINDIYGDLLLDNVYLSMDRGKNQIAWECAINTEHPDLGGSSYYALPEEFQEMCESVDTVVDDKRDAFEETLTNYFAREGYMQGGAFIQMAVDIENGEISPYEWDVETDGEYEDSYEVYANYSHYYDPEEYNINPDVLNDIVESRDFKIALRSALLESPRKEIDTQYFLQMRLTAQEVGGEIKVTVTFVTNRDEPDEMTELFKTLIEGEMDDEDNLNVVFKRVLTQFIKAREPAFMQTNESVVKNWKNFLGS